MNPTRLVLQQVLEIMERTHGNVADLAARMGISIDAAQVLIELAKQLLM